MCARKDNGLFVTYLWQLIGCEIMRLRAGYCFLIQFSFETKRQNSLYCVNVYLLEEVLSMWLTPVCATIEESISLITDWLVSANIINLHGVPLLRIGYIVDRPFMCQGSCYF